MDTEQLYYLLYTLSALIMIVSPLVLGYVLARKLGVGWRLYGIGAATFFLSQVFHIPFNWLIIEQLGLIPTDVSVPANLIIAAIFLGLSAGVFEEVARYLAYRYWARDARSWGQGLMLGAGHGSIEAILVGLLFTINFVVVVAFTRGLITLPPDVPAEATAALEQQADILFSQPWYLALAGGVERLFALTLHLSLSLLLLQVFTRRQLWWLFLAIGWHALANALAVYLLETYGALAAEGVLAVIAIISIAFMFAFKRPEPAEPEQLPLPEPAKARPVDIPLTKEQLEKSRYR